MSQSIFLYEVEQTKPSNDTIDYWKHYSLQQSPFEDGLQYAMYYPIPHWQAYLSQLQELPQSSQSITLLTGEPGVGKSMFIAELLTQLNPVFSDCYIKGRATLTPMALIYDIAQGLNLPLPFTQPNLSDQLHTVLNMLQRLGKVAVVVIDDADLLSMECLSIIGQFALAQSNQSLHLYFILACSINISESLQGILEASTKNPHLPVLMLQPLTVAETENYIKHRFTKAGLIGKMPLTPAILKRIYELSNGVPGRINRVVQQILIDLLKPNEQRLPTNKEKPQRTIDSMGIMRYSIIFLFVIFAWGIWHFNEDAITKTVQASTQKITAIMPTKAENVAVLQNSPPIAEASVPVPVNAPTPTITTVAAANNNTAAIVQYQIPPTIAAPTIAKEDSSLSMPSQVTAEFEPIKTEENAMATATKIAAAIETNSTEDSSSVAKTKSTQSVPSPVLTENEKKLLDMNGYTLQLMGSYNQKDLARFIAQSRLETNRLLQFRTKNQGKPWYVLLYGQYASPEAAKKAINNLPQDVRPWVRPLSSVHRAIKEEA